MKNRIDSLQTIRSLAFWGVFLSHSGIVYFSFGATWGVSVFFILSGFLMTYSYYETNRINRNGIISSIKFGLNKIKKLYPLHIATLVLAFPLFFISLGGYSGVARIVRSSVTTLINALLIQSWFPNREVYFSLNGVSWYLSTTLFLYITFPFILSRIKKYKAITTAAVVILLAYIIQTLLSLFAYYYQVNCLKNDDFIHWFVYTFPLSRLAEFVIGCNLGYIYLNAKASKYETNKQWLYSIYEVLIVLIVILQWIVHLLLVSFPAKADPTVSAEHWWGTIFWTPSSCVLIYLFALKKGIISKALTNKASLYVAGLSANAYLIHKIVYRYLNVIETRVFGQSYLWLNIIICLIITVLASYLWEKYINPFRKKKAINE